MRNKKGFTLVEILGVLVFLGIIMLLAIPNLISILEKNRQTNFIKDTEKFVSTVKYEIRNQNNKPEEGEIVKISLSCLDTESLKEDPYGNEYNKDESYVLIIKKNNQYHYFVNLVSGTGENMTGISLVPEDSLKLDNAEQFLQESVTALTDDEIREIVGVSGKIKEDACFDTTDQAEPYLNADCTVYYDEAGTKEYDGRWTNKDLYLVFTMLGNYKYEIDEYRYREKNVGEWTKIETTSNQAAIKINQTTQNKSYQMEAYLEEVRQGYSTCNVPLKIDKTAINSVVVTGTTELGDNFTTGSWGSGTITLTGSVNPSTTPSGYTYQWYKDGEAISGATSISYGATQTGKYKLEVINGTGTGRQSSEFEIKIDNTIPEKPIITASDSITSGNWHKANFTLNFSGSNTPSGITYYYGTSSNPTTEGSSLSITTDTSASGTKYYVKACSGAGVCGSTSEYVVKLDTSIPDKPVITASDGITSGAWHTANVTLNFSGSSSTSGITYYYGTSSSSMTSTGSSVTYSTNTTGVTYYVKACNGAGTCGSTASYQIKLDKKTPETPTITATDGITSGNWHTANVTLNFSGSSSTSNITYYYGTSSSSMTSTGSSASITSDTKTTTYYVKACNGAGTCGSTASYTVKLDKTKPEVTNTTNNSNSSWTNGTVVITASATDATSGVNQIYYYYSADSLLKDWDTNNTTSVSGTWSAQRDQEVFIIAIDNAGNKSDPVSAGRVRIDTTVPGTPTVTYNGGSNSCTWKNNYSISLSASDNISVSYYEIDVDNNGTADRTTTGSFVPENGFSSCGVRFRTVDHVGNRSGWTDVHHIHMDTESPGTASVSYNSGSNSCSWKNNYNMNLSASDNIGVSYYEIDTNGDGTADGTAGSNYIPGNGHNSCTNRFRAVDHAGNRGAWSGEHHIHMDTATPGTPTVSYAGGSNSCTWKNNYNINLSASDNTGISYYEIDWDSDGVANTTTSSNFVPWNGYSSCTTRFRSVDYAGNVGSWTDNHHIHMDTENPVHTSWWWGTVNTTTAYLYIQTSDNIGISSVQCPTSTESGSYNNWNWFTATWDSSANAYRCDITPSTFGHYNQTYKTHLYINDHAGNGGYYNETTVNIPAICTYSVGQTWSYNYTGSTQNFIVPCDGTYKLEVYGGQGGRSGGLGGYSSGTKTLSRNSTLYIVVGGQGGDQAGGYNGGGSGGAASMNASDEVLCPSGGGGGGATHIGTFNNTLAAHGSTSGLYIVAGGGGGSLMACHTGTIVVGGAGGGSSGASSTIDNGCLINSVSGGTQSSGYLFGQGQKGRDGQSGYCNAEGNGGGGGGLYGGLAYTSTETFSDATGAGGSGYIGGVTSGSTSSGQRTGNGYAVITLTALSN